MLLQNVFLIRYNFFFLGEELLKIKINNIFQISIILTNQWLYQKLKICTFPKEGCSLHNFEKKGKFYHSRSDLICFNFHDMAFAWRFKN